MSLCCSVENVLTKDSQRELNTENSAVRDKQQDLQDLQRVNAAESSRWKREIDRANAEYGNLSSSNPHHSDL